jgi:hypothetical protein
LDVVEKVPGEPRDEQLSPVNIVATREALTWFKDEWKGKILRNGMSVIFESDFCSVGGPSSR